MRKGSKTTSLGPYTDQRWKRIQGLKEQFEKDPLEVQEKTSRYEARKRLEKARSEIVANVSLERGDIMSRSCFHVKDGFCHYWVWPKKMPFFTFFEDVYKEKVEYIKSRDEGDTNWIIKPHPFYCTNCIAYERKNARALGVASSRSPLHPDRDDFPCEPSHGVLKLRKKNRFSKKMVEIKRTDVDRHEDQHDNHERPQNGHGYPREPPGEAPRKAPRETPREPDQPGGPREDDGYDDDGDDDTEYGGIVVVGPITTSSIPVVSGTEG
jgi:hypothetical protein